MEYDTSSDKLKNFNENFYSDENRSETQDQMCCPYMYDYRRKPNQGLNGWNYWYLWHILNGNHGWNGWNNWNSWHGGHSRHRNDESQF